MSKARLIPLMVILGIPAFALAAGFSGTDNFNDGVIATNLWSPPMTMGDAGLIETNGHLHFFATSNPGSGWNRAELPWRTSAPFDYDWQAQVTVAIPDLVNTATQQYQMGFCLTLNDASQTANYRVSFLLGKDETNARKFFLNIVTNGVETHDAPQARIADSATIRFRWVAATSSLYTEVSTNGGSAWADLWGPWYNPLGMKATDCFVCMIDGGSEGGKVVNVVNNLYCDDFVTTVSGPVMTSFGNGDLTWTDINTSSVFTVEWAPQLGGPWYRTWTNLTGVHMTDTNKTVKVPMFYRVVRDSQ